MNVYLEIFGYIGTALVIVSMMMTSVVKLRIINMCGGLISLIYAVCVNTWPVAVLNVCLICINLVQTVRLLKGREDLQQVCLEGHDPTAEHLLNAWRTDFEKCNPACNLEEIRDRWHPIFDLITSHCKHQGACPCNACKTKLMLKQIGDRK